MTSPLCPLCGMPYERLTAKAREWKRGEHFDANRLRTGLTYFHVGGRECEDWEPKE